MHTLVFELKHNLLCISYASGLTVVINVSHRAGYPKKEGKEKKTTHSNKKIMTTITVGLYGPEK